MGRSSSAPKPSSSRRPSSMAARKPAETNRWHRGSVLVALDQVRVRTDLGLVPGQLQRAVRDQPGGTASGATFNGKGSSRSFTRRAGDDQAVQGVRVPEQHQQRHQAAETVPQKDLGQARRARRRGVALLAQETGSGPRPGRGCPWASPRTPPLRPNPRWSRAETDQPCPVQPPGHVAVALAVLAVAVADAPPGPGARGAPSGRRPGRHRPTAAHEPT